MPSTLMCPLYVDSSWVFLPCVRTRKDERYAGMEAQHASRLLSLPSIQLLERGTFGGHAV